MVPSVIIPFVSVPQAGFQAIDTFLGLKLENVETTSFVRVLTQAEGVIGRAKSVVKPVYDTGKHSLEYKTGLPPPS